MTPFDRSYMTSYLKLVCYWSLTLIVQVIIEKCNHVFFLTHSAERRFHFRIQIIHSMNRNRSTIVSDSWTSCSYNYWHRERGGTARHWCFPNPDVIISLRCCWDTSTGCLWNRESTSNWRCLFISHCMVLLRHTCRTTVSSSRTWDVDISGLPTSTRVSSHGHSHRLVTGVSL